MNCINTNSDDPVNMAATTSQYEGIINYQSLKDNLKVMLKSFFNSCPVHRTQLPGDE